MSNPLASRRVVFQGLSALGVAAVLAGCGGDAEPSSSTSNATSEPPSPTESTPTEPAPSSASPSNKDKPSGSGQPALATTDEVPVGGGIVLMDERIVITQPKAGQFVAWSAICKHEGQTVGSVENNVIICPYHGSRYDAASGDVIGGPAPTGLDPVQIKVTKGRITRA